MISFFHLQSGLNKDFLLRFSPNEKVTALPFDGVTSFKADVVFVGLFIFSWVQAAKVKTKSNDKNLESGINLFFQNFKN